MSFWGKTTFYANNMHNLSGCVLSFRVTCWMFIILQLIYLVFPTFHFSMASPSETVSVAVELVPLWFILPDVVITTVVASSHCAFHFQDS